MFLTSSRCVSTKRYILSSFGDLSSSDSREVEGSSDNDRSWPLALVAVKRVDVDGMGSMLSALLGAEAAAIFSK